MPSTPVVVLDSTLTNIANAIRSKTGGSATMKPGQMPAQIAAIPSGGGAGIPREVDSNGVYGFPTQSFTFSLPANATKIDGKSVLNNALRDCTTLASVDFGLITEISGESAIYYAFYGCTNLTSVNLGSLVTISGRDALGSAFRGCTNLASVNLSALSTISGANVMSYAFEGCTSLASVNFASLSTISGGSALADAFRGCTSLTSISFPALTPSSFTGTVVNQLNRLINGVTGCTLHFPAATQAKIETMDGYPNFGGTNTTVLFDL